ncbi:hypothetical protein [uncultured Zobellia sp.]|uniref:hypothetical protein n=1 Tax=uncultured Zobellia sp. TaxID=255433 RepID=UPI002594A5FA|nr:hypothetical protein [uncultured Zobellia sp.]
MQINQNNTYQLLELNGQNSIRNFSAEVINVIGIKGIRQHSCMAMLFSFQYLGPTPHGELRYRFIVNKRLFLDEKERPVFKPSKTQKLALAVANINNNLLFEVTKNFELVGVKNTEEIRSRWKTIRTSLLLSYPDLKDLCNDFDKQLSEENIQSLFKNDNFYNFFFANIFYRKLDNDSFSVAKKIVSNGLGNISVPIIESRQITKQDRYFQNITIATEGRLDVENKTFPLNELNQFLGELPVELGSKHGLDFVYQSNYQVSPRIGLITQGKLDYVFEVKNLYKKNTTINFKLEKDE